MKIKPTSRGLAFIIATILGAFIPSAPAQILSNGGFELPLVAPGSAIAYTAGQSFGGWTVDIGRIWLGSDISIFTVFSGLQSAYLGGTFHQDLNTVVGTQYTLSYARGCGCDAIGHSVFVSWGTESVTNRFTELAWGSSSHTFTATDVITRLSFSGSDVSLDDVSVLPITPPRLQPLAHPGKWLPSAPGYAWNVKVVGNYAYVAVGEGGLAVVDVRNPANCVRVGGYANEPFGYAQDVAVMGNYAYVADGGAGLQVIDISNPTNCVRVSGYTTNGAAYGVAVSGNYGYVAYGDRWNGSNYFRSMQVIDISNPTNCVLVGSYVTEPDLWGGAVRGITVSSNYAYLVGPWGIRVIDVSNPTNCIPLGGCPSGGDFGFSDVAISGKYAYISYGDLDAGGPGEGGLVVIDVSDPTNCVRVGRYHGYGRAFGVAVERNYAYVANGRAGLHVIDVSNPTNLVRVGGYDALTSAQGVTVVASRIYVAAAETGLLVLPTLPNVQFTVRVDTTPGLPFTLEAATNLLSPIHWTPLFTTNVPAILFDYVDYDVKFSENPQKYYRVRQP